MLPFETVVTFFTAAMMLGMAPGPDNIFVLTQSALHGRNQGFVIVMGLCTGLMLHTMAVALGVAVIFQTSAAAFTVLKLIGVGYLLYLAWQAFRATAPAIQSQGSEVFNSRGYYCRGIFMNVTNPKVSLFFLAFLPQFADPSRGPVIYQLLLLGGLFIMATVLVFGSIALLAGTMSHWFKRSDRVQTIMTRLTGTVFVALAIKLAMSQR